MLAPIRAAVPACGLAVGLAAFAIHGRSHDGLNGGQTLAFRHVVVDTAGPQDIWLKSVGDLNGDGRQDLIAGGHRSGGLVWYENPNWDKHVIAAEGAFGTDGEAADLDGDGDQDLVVIVGKQLVWYENPSWKTHPVDDVMLHDIEVTDLDGDGRPDIVGRDQGAFAGHRGDLLHIYRQESPSSWRHRTVNIPDGEGLLSADVDHDGRPDVVVGRFWVRNPGNVLNGAWTLHEYGQEWDYPHVFVAAGDVNGDGRLDIILVPSEKAGGTYRISWFEGPRNPRSGAWKEHIIAPSVETVKHFVGVGDFNRDGRLDVATASMRQGKSPEIDVYVNQGKGQQWIKSVVAPTSSHSMRIVDVDGDGLPDLYGADWSGSRQVDLWMNVTGKPGQAGSGSALAHPDRNRAARTYRR